MDSRMLQQSKNRDHFNVNVKVVVYLTLNSGIKKPFFNRKKINV